MSWTLPTCRRSLRLQTTMIVQWSLMFIRLPRCLESIDLQVRFEKSSVFAVTWMRHDSNSRWYKRQKGSLYICYKLHERTHKTQHTWQIVFSIRGLDCPEVNPVPVAYQRMNGSWVCAAGYAGSVQALSVWLCECPVFVCVNSHRFMFISFPREHANKNVSSRLKWKWKCRWTSVKVQCFWRATQ